ncbi:MAG: bifunctional phosphopantothenoylcysteine decarboxylase/phosphopantothenate--cysteine ligase CoaBC [Chlorobi bacterium]|nr:bifunctional phosphopantothenoylcysteine decarboxylase/phosphopantothenate--cysteine ligase CoaBC [Chlorobiota bacterium]
MLKGKRILLGVTGSIAAYKSVWLVRSLVKEGAEVKVIMTPSATDFITPLTLSVVSGNPVYLKPYNPDTGEWHSHIDLGFWADIFLIGPATANTIGKMAHGVADNLLLTTYLSARCPVMVAPAMDVDMFRSKPHQDNLKILAERNCIILNSPEGDLASGLTGEGRFLEPEEIIYELKNYFARFPEKKTKIAGKKILITAGPTFEPIDPVRYIGNHSSGKMGVALAEKAVQMGAEVVLILGPTSVKPVPGKIEVIHVTTAEEMYKAAKTHFPVTDIAIMAAAVADFTPTETFNRKVKRGKEDLVLRLKPTRDIAAMLGKQKHTNQLIVGFALESNDEIENARKKLVRKNLDFIVLNSLNDDQAGFGYDTNKITILDKSGNQKEYPLKSKSEVAGDILSYLQEQI